MFAYFFLSVVLYYIAGSRRKINSSDGPILYRGRLLFCSCPSPGGGPVGGCWRRHPWLQPHNLLNFGYSICNGDQVRLGSL